MFKVRTTGLLLGVLILTPALALASPQAQTTSKPPAKPAPASTATKATTGVVKSVDGSSLVITRPSGSVKEMTFVLNDSTQKKGALAAGAAVEVRYKIDGKQNVATAVTVQAKKK